MALSIYSTGILSLKSLGRRNAGASKLIFKNRSYLVISSTNASTSSSLIAQRSFRRLYSPQNIWNIPMRSYFATPSMLQNGYNDNAFENDISGYQSVVAQTMKDLQEKFEELEELDLPGFEVNEKDGVFELKLGEKGTYVINKQAPNKQLWWSSPLSGPKRYNYDPQMQAWRNTRDGHLMYDLLNEEITSLVGQEFDVYTVAARPKNQ